MSPSDFLHSQGQNGETSLIEAAMDRLQLFTCVAIL